LKHQDHIKNFLGRAITNSEGRILYYSERWDEYLFDYQFCSEEFLCNTCLREGKLVKGITRFDSLVQCEKHAPRARELLEQLTDAINQGMDKSN
jgi:hypothetical protein